LLDNPFPIEEWTYYIGSRLLAVAYVDALPEALSAIYCYYEAVVRQNRIVPFWPLIHLGNARQDTACWRR
jgi:arginyl-tRNA--protein-N-Asp/Glu arginylyltransferase